MAIHSDTSLIHMYRKCLEMYRHVSILDGNVEIKNVKTIFVANKMHVHICTQRHILGGSTLIDSVWFVHPRENVRQSSVVYVREPHQFNLNL